MSRLGMILLAAAPVLAGCQMDEYRCQPLGEVAYDEAFRVGRAVLAQYFSIASADPQSGKIVSRPKPIKAAPDRLLGSSPARQLAILRIRRTGGDLYADLRVHIQRQDAGAARAMQPVTVQTEMPNVTPAEETAAVTTEQSQAWENVGRDHALERTILADLLRQLTQSE